MAGAISGASVNKRFMKYDVFLNHRGDVKERFVVPLEKKLREADKEPFLDTMNIGFGEDVFGTIEEAVSTARMHIAVFSDNYAESTYCLRELQQMFLTGKPIITVFYDVKPEHVRRPRDPRGPYAKAFKKHDGRRNLDHEDVINWEKALTQAASIRGFIRSSYRDDDELARNIVEEVGRLLSPQTLQVPSNWGQYDWKFHYKFPKEGQGMVLFAADTSADVRVAFSPEAGPFDLMYEIVIGGWKKPKSVVIRKQEKELCSASGLKFHDDGDEDEGSYHFWVSIDAETQLIHVGQGQNPCLANAFLICRDPEFVSKVQYFSFSSYDAAIKYTNIRVESRTLTQQSMLSNLNQNFTEDLHSIYRTETELESTEAPILIQASEGRYDWSKYYKLPTAGQGIISFAATAVTNVLVAISPEAQTMDPMYEIVIGGWANTKSAIRRKSQGVNLSRARTIGVIKSQVLNRFWVSIDGNTQFIHVGRGRQPSLESAFCIYKDANFINDARCVSFSSCEAPVSCSDIFVASPSGPLVSSQFLEVPPAHATYAEWSEHRKLPEEGRGIVFFAAKTSTDVHVAISPEPQTACPMYEVVIGGWNNSQSVIRKQSQGTNLCTTPAGLNDPFIGPGWCHFWVSIDASTRIIRVGRGKQADLDSSVICIYKDLNFITKARYVSYSSWDVPITYSGIRIASIDSPT